MSTPPATARVLADIAAERIRQDAKWGPQHHPDGTGPDEQLFGVTFSWLATMARTSCDETHRAGRGTWLGILAEEGCEAAAESSLAALRAELVQVAAVCVNWVEDIDSRRPVAADSAVPATAGSARP